MGLHKTMVRDGVVDRHAFADAMRHARPVGTCETCRADLAGYLEEAGAIVWFVGRCPNGHELPAPNGRVAVRPRRHRVRPLPSAELLQEWQDMEARMFGERAEAA